MADFYQTGVVTTLHRLNPDGLDRLERELERFSADVSVGLVLPALYSEFKTPAMRRIASELRTVHYLHDIVVVLGRANYSEYQHARSFFEDFESPVTFMWVDSEPMQRLLRLLEQNGISAGADGKGRSCWLAYGYLLATGACDVIALHDCDILNYTRELLARLCYPVVNPNLEFEFCKGYYARVTDRMHGRVTRLFMTPLIRALQGLAPSCDFLHFLDSFRYPLAGEFAMKAELARANRIPGDWGLELGALAEVYRKCTPARTCQVDLADNYEHKHQALSAGDRSQGLRKMTIDIANCLFRTLASEGVVLGPDEFRTLEIRYLRMAEDTIRRYYADALLNGLKFDLHAEELAVNTFAKSLREAARAYLEDPLGAPLIPNWNRVVAAIPDFFERLLDAVSATNRDTCRIGSGPGVAAEVCVA
ncbi:MAG: glycosyl transferase [Acidobacteria bacterium]|nr:glycosyl transferase [Acidobacteriota bacterium]